MSTPSALSRIRQASFPGSAFGSTRHAALKKELAERLVCPHIPAGAAIYHWYEHSKDEVHVYLCHFSFDEVKPGMDIPVDPDVRLKPMGSEWVEVARYRTAQEAIEGAKKAVADREKAGSEEPAKVKTWRDRAMEDPML
jgi:hypothetical protein